AEAGERGGLALAGLRLDDVVPGPRHVERQRPAVERRPAGEELEPMAARALAALPAPVLVVVGLGLVGVAVLEQPARLAEAPPLQVERERAGLLRGGALGREDRIAGHAHAAGGGGTGKGEQEQQAQDGRERGERAREASRHRKRLQADAARRASA